MKNFFRTILAVILGNIIYSIISLFMIFILIIIIASASGSARDKTSITPHSILKVSIPSSLNEMSENKEFNINLGDEEEMISLHQIVASIEHAKNNSNIDALYIDMNYNGEISYSQIDILRKALIDFKTSKKPIIAYGEMVSQKSYYLASVADKVYLNPNGGMDIRGFGAQIMFFKKTLDKLGIEPQIFYAGKFKSATEPLRLEKMSDANKIQTRALLEDISKVVLSNIASNRKISVDTLQACINNLSIMDPSTAWTHHLIDGAKYIDEVEAEMRNLIHIEKSQKIDYLGLNSYYSNQITESKSGKIAVYIAEGEIVDGTDDDGNIASQKMIKTIREMAADDHIKGVVLRINSPGGSALASSVILRELELLQSKKPMVVSMGNVAASGGYYIASSAEKIFAEPNTITGSIGVFGIIPNMSKFLDDKIGITFDEVELNDHAVMNVNKPLDAIEAAKIQFEIDKTYSTFKSVVSKGRHLTMEQVDSIAQGRVWSGLRAKTIGLVDEIGGLEEAVAYLAKKTKTPSNDYFIFNSKKDKITRFIEKLNTKSLIKNMIESHLKEELGNNYSFYQTAKKLNHWKGIQMSMPYAIELK
jgi:protease-4